MLNSQYGDVEVLMARFVEWTVCNQYVLIFSFSCYFISKNQVWLNEVCYADYGVKIVDVGRKVEDNWRPS